MSKLGCEHIAINAARRFHAKGQIVFDQVIEKGTKKKKFLGTSHSLISAWLQNLIYIMSRMAHWSPAQPGRPRVSRMAKLLQGCKGEGKAFCIEGRKSKLHLRFGLQ